MVSKAIFSSKSDEWATPTELFNTLNKMFNFTLDPCSSQDNYKCQKHYTKKEDGLNKDWSDEIVFMNPPYSECSSWMKKAKESKAFTVALVPSRTDTRWWHDYCLNTTLLFIKGRLKFGESKNSAPFPSVLIIFDNIDYSDLDKGVFWSFNNFIEINEEVDVIEI